jgi:Undecaprenyl-phosphate glucose phosphotransferase
MYATENRLLTIYIIVDLLLLNLSIPLAYYFDLGDIRSFKPSHVPLYMALSTVAWIVTYFTFTKHNLYLRDTFRHRMYRICRRVILFTMALIVLIFVFMREPVARIYILSYISIFLVLEIVGYRLIYKYMYYRRSREQYSKRILLIGYDETSCLFRKMIENTPLLGYKFVGYVKYNSHKVSDIPPKERSCLIGNISQLAQIIEEHDIHVVFSIYSYFLDKIGIDEQLAVCNQMGIRMYLVSEHQRWLRRGHDVETIGNFYVLNPQRIPLDNLFNRSLKRTLDVFSSLFVMLCFGWNLLPLVVLIIRTTSKGPAFFVQERTGLDNVPFRCYKFRSMYLNRDSDKKQATKNDSRITPFGRFMRKWNIDELPQFYNVLCGQMSIVGPRPHMIRHTEQYSALIKYYKARHYVKPGITGWAQVNGWRGETDTAWKMEKRVKYDRDYIENWSFLWDIKIIWLTLFGKNAWTNAH